ncbi:Ectonucleoside triphosphate diphosphohydrolase 2 [Galemys pyrenaicus]|uniref:Ectonucleoside triphosphate diphosphohydrolase 2 n=1 Tax=Galemys pyrenaicus TaxID=202257 RepID=A0A8J6AFT3_GALPY|nr:Ectonucleoside triphosphate diphosphohydrolase 2 [Galemys pyrenaicus]
MAGKLLSLLPPLLLAAAGLAGLLLLYVPARDVREPPALQYGIVLDAGSSHTSVFVYKWPADKENDTGIVSQHSTCDVEGGGISSYSDDPAGAGRSLVACMDSMLQAVPRDRHADTPLYLGATAGMRLLSWRDPAATALVLEEVERTLARYPFSFRGAHILSGKDEGVFGWVTANYLLGNFIKHDWGGSWLQPRTKTLGAMDLGGASTQITFQTDSPAEDPAAVVQLQLYGQPYRVYTHSFLCYGRDQVLLRLWASAQQTHGFHPCWPRNQTVQDETLLKSVRQSPCTTAQRPSALNSSERVILEGRSDPVLCRSLVAGLFKHPPCNFSRCSFDGVFQPPLPRGFIAFSAFFHSVNFLKNTVRLPVGTLQQLTSSVDTLCRWTWEELQNRAREEKPKHLRDSCAGAMLVQHLLSVRYGYGFDEHTFSGVDFQKKVGDTAVGWALGYMLNLTNMIPADSPQLRKGLDFSSWVVLLLLFVALVLAAIVLLLRQARSAKSPSVI